MRGQPPRAWAVLTITHALLIALGFYFGLKEARTRRDLTLEYTADFAKFPRRDAAELAFRFGTLEHAKILVADRPAEPFEVTTNQLRLAALDGEHLQPSPGPHLLAALASCERAAKCPCSLDKFRQQAASLAKMRRE
jgi:hypothetical protein